MHKIIISDTSCFIVLANIGELDILQKLYGKIFTTPEIVSEYGDALPDWVEIQNATDKFSQQLLEIQIDKGEASAIALAMENSGSTLILDDYKARKIAEQLGIDITGTIGVIIKAKLKGIITSIKPLLEKISLTDFRLAADIKILALKEAQE